jgi:hypothetical protein
VNGDTKKVRFAVFPSFATFVSIVGWQGARVNTLVIKIRSSDEPKNGNHAG